MKSFLNLSKFRDLASCVVVIATLINFSMFRLPDDKILAIKDSAFGTVAKIYLLYDSAWWSNEMASFDFLFPNSTDFRYTEAEAEEDWTRWVLSAYR